MSGLISSIWDGICDFFGIRSPSREMGWIGEMLVKGLAGSIEDNGDEAVKVFRRVWRLTLMMLCIALPKI